MRRCTDNPIINAENQLEQIMDFLQRYLVCSDSQRLVLALWIMHTHCLSASDVSPYLDIRSAQNLLVIKTIVGSAQPVAAALDEADWTEVVGTLACDDTILIVCPDKEEARKLAARIEEMLS